MCCNFEAPWSFPFFLRIKEKIPFRLAANGPTLPGPSSRAALASTLAASCSRFSAAHMAHQILNTFCVSIYIIFVFLVFGRPRVAGPGTHLKWWWWWISEKPPENNWISRFGFCSFIHFLVLRGRIPSFFFVCVSGRVNMARFEVLLGHKMGFSGSHPTEKQAGAIFHFPLANAFQKS